MRLGAGELVRAIAVGQQRRFGVDDDVGDADRRTIDKVDPELARDTLALRSNFEVRHQLDILIDILELREENTDLRFGPSAERAEDKLRVGTTDTSGDSCILGIETKTQNTPESERGLIRSCRCEATAADSPPCGVEAALLVVTIIRYVVDNHRTGHQTSAALKRNRHNEARLLKNLLLFECETLEAALRLNEASQNTKVRSLNVHLRMVDSRTARVRRVCCCLLPTCNRVGVAMSNTTNLGRIGIRSKNLTQRTVIVGVAVTEALGLRAVPSRCDISDHRILPIIVGIKHRDAAVAALAQNRLIVRHHEIDMGTLSN